MESMIKLGSWAGRPGDLLAKRELMCVLSVANGQSDKQIAAHEGISPSTVKNAIERAMHKLCAYKRPQLIAEAMRRGLIAPLMILLASFGGYHCAVSLDGDHQRRGPSRRVVEVRVLASRAATEIAA